MWFRRRPWWRQDNPGIILIITWWFQSFYIYHGKFLLKDVSIYFCALLCIAYAHWTPQVQRPNAKLLVTSVMSWNLPNSVNIIGLTTDALFPSYPCLLIKSGKSWTVMTSCAAESSPVICASIKESDNYPWITCWITAWGIVHCHDDNGCLWICLIRRRRCC